MWFLILSFLYINKNLTNLKKYNKDREKLDQFAKYVRKYEKNFSYVLDASYDWMCLL